MSSYRGPRCRIERRLETLLFGRKSNILLKKNKAPGMHGVRRKKSSYKVGLDAKQVCSFYYGGIIRKQLISNLRKASKTKTLKLSQSGTIGAFAGRLESRLDAIVKRLGFADSPRFARQLISHGKILVNGKKQTIKSYIVKSGSTISLSESAKKMKRIEESRERCGKDIPSYLVLNNDYEGMLTAFPELESIPAHTHGIIDYASTVQYLNKHI